MSGVAYEEALRFPHLPTHECNIVYMPMVRQWDRPKVISPYARPKPSRVTPPTVHLRSRPHSAKIGFLFTTPVTEAMQQADSLELEGMEFMVSLGIDSCIGSGPLEVCTYSPAVQR